MAKKNRNIALGTLVVGFIGYGVGLLTAPKSGKATRKAMQKKSAQAKADAEKKLKKLHSELNDLMVTGNDTVANLKSKLSEEYLEALKKAGSVKEKARDMLSAVHEGDAGDKDLQKAIKEVTKAIEHLKKYSQKND